MLKNVKIGTKLIGGFILVALIVLVVGVVGWSSSRELGDHIEEIGLVRLPSIESLLKVELHLEELMTAQRSLLSTELSVEERASYLQTFHDARDAYKEEWAYFLTLPATAEEERLSGKFEEELTHWAAVNDQWIELDRSFEGLDIQEPQELVAQLQQFRGDHYALEVEVAQLLLTGKMFSGGEDPTACNFGRWLAGFSTENSQLEALVANVHGPHNRFHQTAGEIRDLVQSNNTEGAITAFQNDFLPASEQVFGYFDKIIALVDEADALLDQGAELAFGSIAEEAYAAMAILDQLIHINEEIADTAVAQANAAGARAEVTALIGMAAGLVIALILGITIAMGITRPVSVAAAFAQRIAKGELDIELPIQQKDEIGVLADAMREMLEAIRYKAGIVEKVAEGDLTMDITLASENDGLGISLQKMVASLNEILGQVREAAEQVSSGSGQVSQSSQSLSQGATEQASSLEEISSSLNEIASQSKQNADNSTEANSLAKSATEVAETGNSQMKELVTAMETINASSEEINKVVKVIDDIAFQINLLALNANVEAARAGKYGKGFAVVAEEVRNLAVRSTDSVKETTQMVEESTRSTELGSEIAGKVAGQLEEIVTGISKVSDVLGEVAVASKEQAQGVEQINEGLEQIDQVTQANTASAEESASASEELSAQAQQLNGMVGRFKLQNGGKNGKQKIATQNVVRAEPGSGGNGNETPRIEAGGSDQDDQKEKAGVAKGARPVDPKEVIKLDDDDFGRF
jgi:methyl-accepting chemotaxis protein